MWLVVPAGIFQTDRGELGATMIPDDTVVAALLLNMRDFY